MEINKKILEKVKNKEEERRYIQRCFDNNICPKCGSKLEFVCTRKYHKKKGLFSFLATATYTLTSGYKCDSCEWNNIENKELEEDY